MKKVLLICLGAALLTTSNVSAQAVEEGNVIIDAYYGFPNLFTTTLKNAYGNSSSATDVKVGGLGPLGGRIEYLITDNVGIGLDVGNVSTYIEYTDIPGFDSTRYDYRLSTSKIGAMVTFNFHFVDNDQLDVAGIIGAGWKNRTWKWESNDPNWDTESTTGSLLPVSFKLGLVMRYFFTDNIGMNLGVGLGQGGLLNGGLSVKF